MARKSKEPHLEWVEATANNPWYWRTVKHVAKALKSDGCTGVPDFYVDACLEHDCFYRTHQTIFGAPITKDEADWILKRRIQQWSWLGWLSPMAQWRYWFLRRFVRKPWERGGKQKITPYKLMT